MTTTTASTPFQFPPIHSFPPFYTLQPNTTTLRSQLTTWSTIIRSYCRHHRLFKLSLSDVLESDLFINRTLNKRLKASDARTVLKFMRDSEKSAEPVAEMINNKKGGGVDEANVWWIWWRKVEEWAGLVESWVDDTGLKNTVLTLYEITESDITRGTELHGLDPGVLQKALALLVKKGKAQVFGAEDQQGVKFS